MAEREHNVNHYGKEENDGWQWETGPAQAARDGTSAEGVPRSPEGDSERGTSADVGCSPDRTGGVLPGQGQDAAAQLAPSDILKLKAKVRARDGFRCVQCGMTNEEHKAKYGRQLDVHRIVPGKRYVAETCETLCLLCHYPKPKSLPGQNEDRLTAQIDPALKALIALRAAEAGQSLAECAVEVICLGLGVDPTVYRRVRKTPGRKPTVQPAVKRSRKGKT